MVDMEKAKIVEYKGMRVLADETDTSGKYTYLVGQYTGGIQGSPEHYYENLQIIRADSESEASDKYDKINNCYYYYGKVMKRID